MVSYLGSGGLLASWFDGRVRSMANLESCGCPMQMLLPCNGREMSRGDSPPLSNACALVYAVDETAPDAPRSLHRTSNRIQSYLNLFVPFGDVAERGSGEDRGSRWTVWK